MYNLKRRAKILFSLLPISALMLLLLSSITQHKKTPQTHVLHIHKHLQVAHSACEGTLYPELCVETLSSFPDLASKSLPEIISASVNHTVKVVRHSASNCTRIKRQIKNLNKVEKRALEDCLELFENTIDEFITALPYLVNQTTCSQRRDDLQTLLSAAMTNQYTCLDGFSHSSGNVRHLIEKGLYKISKLVSNSLAMLMKIPKVKTKDSELLPGYGSMVDGFPRWLSREDRRLLQASTNTTKFDLVVAQDGSGNFTTISDAVAAAPNKTTTRFVIYIKAGAYLENVEVPKKKVMLMFIGDGIGKTVVKASLNVVDGSTTYNSSTVAVVGEGFIARDMTFENSAGAIKHQAVALRDDADLSVFYNCSFVGYQDTLYARLNRQFYKQCDVYGTVDFIFGNAAVVFQDCNLYARKPISGQQNTFTAQGRTDINQNTGTSVITSKVEAAADLIPVLSSVKSYLGRPWKEYSRTVFLESYLGSLIDPAGWLEWNSTFAFSTLYYGEYKNRGPGSNTTDRVTWPGYRVITNATVASQFSVDNFIQGDVWLPATGIPFNGSLS